jgi:hypothetical protein
MRFERSVTSVSWIPSESIPGVMKVAMDSGLGHYDRPQPDKLGDLKTMSRDGRFRFANHLSAYIEVEDGRITGYGYTGGGVLSDTIIGSGPAAHRFHGVSFPDLQREPEVGPTSVRFGQTTGGRTGAPMPLPVRRWPPISLIAPSVWTTLALTIHADGTFQNELIGASKFPRHWIYGNDGVLFAKVGSADFRGWMRTSVGRNTPWSGRDRRPIVTRAETALERDLSAHIMHCPPPMARIPAGATLVEQGSADETVYLVLDGVLDVEVDGRVVDRIGPGSVVGERAQLEGGKRTATLRAVTHVRVAQARRWHASPEALAELAQGHRREVAN